MTTPGDSVTGEPQATPPEAHRLKVEFRLDDGYQPVSFSQEFEMHGGWNPQQIVELMSQRWRELRAEYMEMFIDEPGGRESAWQQRREGRNG